MRKDICVEKRGHWKRATNLRESTSGQISEDLPDIWPDATALLRQPSRAMRANFYQQRWKVWGAGKV
jgi:hypothetical protein